MNCIFLLIEDDLDRLDSMKIEIVPTVPVIRYNHPFVPTLSSTMLTKPLYREIVNKTTDRIMKITASRIFESVIVSNPL